jgi:hypothetical protein
VITFLAILANRMYSFPAIDFTHAHRIATERYGDALLSVVDHNQTVH